MSFQHLGSKLLAGGLTAGLFLLWWPAHLPTSGLGWLIARGIVSTLAFEVLLFSFAPLEARAVGRVVRWSAIRRAGSLKGSLPARARSGGMVAGACLGVALPAALLFDTRPVPPPATKVVERVVVEKPVIERRVVVKRVRVVAPATVAAVTPSATPTAPGRVAAANAPRAASPPAAPRPAGPVPRRTSTPRPTAAPVAPKPERTVPVPAPTPTPAPVASPDAVAPLPDGVLAVARIP